jgi:hypothetical protein
VRFETTVSIKIYAPLASAKSFDNRSPLPILNRMRPHSKRSPPATCGALDAADTGVFAIVGPRFAHVFAGPFGRSESRSLRRWECGLSGQRNWSMHCTPSKRVRVQRVATNWTASEQQRQLPGSLNRTFGNPNKSDSRQPVRLTQKKQGRVEAKICGQSSTYDGVKQDV